MEKYIDVMKKNLELAGSCEEALDHIKVRLSEGFFEETIGLMNDFINGVCKIEMSMSDFLPQLSLIEIEVKMMQLRTAMEKVVSAYEQGEGGKALEAIQFDLLPCHTSWRAEIEKTLNPYVLS
ncbi:hypothetical protein [Paenibacillus cremeus]|uniref:DUF8042 domain-containing protein n=1 Tax=Paenibacillus cremeus TaxID=2163881 RepID=A0A559KB24_9BACL|nr:hypothetical protein [Paenibacillus cremeus]TVY09338.1 hypothetical protein FPZ49_14230 [Paenibacillus cremeus]